MDIRPLLFSTHSEPRQKVLFEIKANNSSVLYGTVFLKKGCRIPDEGFTQHSEHEISYVQSGKIQLLNTDGSMAEILKAGDVVSIEPLEPQAGIVLEDTQIIYVLINMSCEK